MEPVKEPELDEEEKERRRLQEEEQRRQEEIVSTSLHLWGYFSSFNIFTHTHALQATLQEFIDEVKRKNEWKATLRAANQNVESRPEESDLHKLDSSLKKNTAFIRKLKNFTDGQRDVVKKEMSSLNLTKYIGEVAAALVEAKLKTTDLGAALEICSFLHQRYADFSEQLMENWQKALSFKKEGGESGGGKTISNPSKLREAIRWVLKVALYFYDIRSFVSLTKRNFSFKIIVSPHVASTQA